MNRLKRLILSFFPVRWFLSEMLPAIRFSFHAPKMTGAQFNSFIGIVQPGDIVFSADRSKLASWLVPGEWSHAALYVGDGWIVEAVQPKVKMTHAFDFCHSADVVGVVRYEWPELERVLFEAKATVGLPYDAIFEKGKEALYCSELVAMFDEMNLMGFNDQDELGLGLEYVSPDDLWNAKNVTRIFHG